MGPFNDVEVMRNLRESITLLPIGSMGREEIWLACFKCSRKPLSSYHLSLFYLNGPLLFKTKDVMPDGHVKYIPLACEAAVFGCRLQACTDEEPQCFRSPSALENSLVPCFKS